MTAEPTCRRSVSTPHNRATDLAFQPASERFVWITDGGRRVGLIDRDKATLEWIAPHPGIDPPRPPAISRVYHAPAFQGGRIVLQWWLDDGAGQRVDDSQPLKGPFGVLRTHPRSRRPKTRLQFQTDSNNKLMIVATHAYEGDDRIAGRHVVRLGFDPAFNSYVAVVEAELAAPDPYLAEFVNLYAGGVYDNRANRKRYQCTIWQHPDGRYVRWAHNPVSYLAPGMNDRTGERRISTGGFIGYFSDPLGNPAVELIAADPAVSAATCCNLYDEHLICHAPKNLRDGLYHWRVHFRFFSIPIELARHIVEQSQPVHLRTDEQRVDAVLTDAAGDDAPLGRRYLYNPRFPEFQFGRVNDFERPVPCDRLVVGNMIWASANPDNPVYWDESIGHSGHRSIRLTGTPSRPGARTRLAGGPSLHLEGSQTYRLSGWVRTEGVTGAGASIRMDVIGSHADDPPNTIHRTDALNGTIPWMRVEKVFRVSPDAELGWLYLELDGPGVAWFDDVAMEAI
jgi:hypothetical protein